MISLINKVLIKSQWIFSLYHLMFIIKTNVQQITRATWTLYFFKNRDGNTRKYLPESLSGNNKFLGEMWKLSEIYTNGCRKHTHTHTHTQTHTHIHTYCLYKFCGFSHLPGNLYIYIYIYSEIVVYHLFISLNIKNTPT